MKKNYIVLLWYTTNILHFYSIFVNRVLFFKLKISENSSESSAVGKSAPQYSHLFLFGEFFLPHFLQIILFSLNTKILCAALIITQTCLKCNAFFRFLGYRQKNAKHYKKTATLLMKSRCHRKFYFRYTIFSVCMQRRERNAKKHSAIKKTIHIIKIILSPHPKNIGWIVFYSICNWFYNNSFCCFSYIFFSKRWKENSGS